MNNSMKKLLLILIMLHITITAIDHDAVKATVAQITISKKTLSIDDKRIMSTKNLATTKGHKRLKRELKKRNKTRVLLKTESDVPYSVLYQFFDAVSKTDIRSTLQYTDEFGGYYFLPEISPEPECDFVIDSMRFIAVIGDTSVLLGWGTRNRKEIKYHDGRVPKTELRKTMLKLSEDYACAPDHKEVIVAAEDTIPFEKVLDLMHVAHTSRFQFQSFARLYDDRTYEELYDDIIGYYDPSDTLWPKIYREESLQSNNAYFNEVADHFRKIGRKIEKNALHEYTASVFIASFPPVAEVYDTCGFLGLSNKSYLYFKPGKHDITVQKGYKSAYRTLELKPGKNPGVAILLRGTPETIKEKSIQIPVYWFDDDTYKLDDYGKSIIENFCLLIKHTGIEKIAIVKIECPDTSTQSFYRAINSKHIIVVEKELEKNGVDAKNISRRTDLIKNGFCEEALYLVQLKK